MAFPFSEYKELKSVGGSAEGQMPDGMPVIVARVEEDKFVCVSIKCTHQNCDLLYDKKKKLFQCPCHNSAFDLEGQPVGGPARRALKVYAAEAAVVVRSDD